MEKMIINKPKVILFDLDDTIVSFDGVCLPAWQKVCGDFIKKHDVSFDDKELLMAVDDVKDWYWNDPVRHKKGRENLLSARRDVVRYALKKLGISDEELVCEVADGYTYLQDSMIHMLPDALQALENFKKLGIRMAIVTNGASKVQREKIERFGITHFFDNIYIDTEVGYSKPDKRIFEYALKDMNVKADDTWMVGDNLVWDIKGPKQIGIFSVWNDYEHTGIKDNIEVMPDLIVNSIYEMSMILIGC